MDSYTVFHASREIFRETSFGEVFPLNKYENVGVFPKFSYPSLESCYIGTQNIDSNWSIPPKRSTSVGDLVRDDDRGKFYMVDSCGFKEVELPTEPYEGEPQEHARTHVPGETKEKEELEGEVPDFEKTKDVEVELKFLVTFQVPQNYDEKTMKDLIDEMEYAFHSDDAKIIDETMVDVDIMGEIL